MIRIKVIRAAHLAIGLAVAAVVVAVALILLGQASRRPTSKLNTSLPGGGQISAAVGVSGEKPAVAQNGGEASPGDAAKASRNIRTKAEAVRKNFLTAKGLLLTLWPLRRAMGPKSILIYHTHTHEAYAPEPGEEYEALEAWRTEDRDHSVVRVGRALSQALTELGYRVIHDETDHEAGGIEGAYDRSLQTILSYEEPFDLYLDVHRDAYSGKHGEDRAAQIGGQPAARVMFLVGTGESLAPQGKTSESKGESAVWNSPACEANEDMIWDSDALENGDEMGTGGDPLRAKSEVPDWERNLAFARAATGAMNRFAPGSTRPVMTTGQRYNQHAGTLCALVEVGHNRNTLTEALAAVPALALALDEALKGCE